MARRWEVDAALRPGPSMLGVLPREWLVSGSDGGAFFVLGGPLAGDPDVLISVEQACGGGRDLGESVAWLLAELLAAMTSGKALGADLSEAERADLTCRLRMLMRTGRGDG
ncbi:hypothetical protein A8924_6351 [Saccharopolyspora erythraea NRRL 2338]|uniref:Uncharacterized protein n=2 Tax=Saccharopolyspora erythraea TaxID=1836 RepID=A4FMB0_SACEN|nr:hypothetical protein [Saccharopolyspora erythraea]EQD87824.1 hypothetical protein N599_02505 [Saccharopolyspora erythraea D]PFG98825.1 hypothetical protein A8924_6351 [Saccharopolyspora erythraea NRRL 2338]QRK88822.1 hypothetical protein JQX30_30090 [Saccharopolyspora erythraea]CAM05185.1 hypothetical protein SACE_6005 [Saccharopolyspora erythraea NRRL 2338]